jgi:predicted CopG family antitoxin
LKITDDVNKSNEFIINVEVERVSYQALKNMGRAGDSFNDVITYLVKKAGTLDEQ